MRLIHSPHITGGLDPQGHLTLPNRFHEPERGQDCRGDRRGARADGSDWARTSAVTKILGIGAASMLCAALATEPSRAQEDGVVQDTPRGSGAAISTEPVKPEPGSVQRRTNLRAPVVIPPRTAPAVSTSAGTGAPFIRQGADGAAVRNPVGVVMPTTRQLPGHDGPGVAVQGGMRASGAGAVHGNPGDLNFHRPPALPHPAPTPHVTGINGTTMGRIASGSSSVGGPAKDRSGISGTTMRSRP